MQLIPADLFRQTIDTPLGEMTAMTSERGIVLFDFSDNAHLAREVNGLSRYLPGSRIVDGGHPLLTQLTAEIGEYFAGARRDFGVPLHPVGTPFQLDVWATLLTIPYGQTRSYADQARMIGRPTAVRAVANANGHNRLPILIPCHRVIGSDGTLTGYSGGICRKTELLRLERCFML